MSKIDLDPELIQKLRDVLDSIPDLEFAALFGSITTGGSYHDLDLGVKFSSGDKYEALCSILELISKSLGIPEEKIDLVDLERANLEFKLEILKHGLVLLDRIQYSNQLLESVSQIHPEYSQILERDLKDWLESPNPRQLDSRLIKRRMDFIWKELEFLRAEIFNLDPDRFSEILKRALERSYHLILEAMLDICRHIVSVKGWGPASSYAELIRICVEHGVLSSELGERMLKGIRLRNLLIHRYLEIDYRRLHQEAISLPELVEKFEYQILRLLRELI